MRVAVMNNYHAHLLDEPKPRGLRNIVANIENMGNIMFLETITRQLGATAVSAYEDLHRTDYMNTFDVLVLPLANMISPVWTAHHGLLTALEKLEIPIIVMSVGVQAATTTELIDFVVSEDAQRVLNLTRKSGTTIGARGYLTEQVLRDHGYTNIQTIGCPSIYYSSLNIRSLAPEPRIAIHASLQGDRIAVGHLLSFGIKFADAYIAQNESRFIVNQHQIPFEVYSQWTTDRQRLTELQNINFPYTYYNDGQFSAEVIRSWIDSHLVFFSDIDEWISYLSAFDFVIGSRYHGTVAALLAGTPTFLYTIDMRTKELAEYHSIPHAPITTLHEDTTIKQVYEHIDYDTFMFQVRQRRVEYEKYLAMHNLKLLTD